MDDREVVLAIMAGDPAGLAAAYDRYAAALYGYCYWLLREPAAADALQKTFIIALTRLGDLDDASHLRSWLYRSARDECYRRMLTTGRGFSDAANTAEYPADGNNATQQAELRRLIQATLATLEQDEGEVIELNVRHGLSEYEIAAVLRASWSRVHALSTHAYTHLSRTLDALLIARTGRKACLVLDALLADWDGRLTIHIGKLVSHHVDGCEACASHTHGGLRPEVLAGLLPLATPPAELREQILERLSVLSEPATIRLKAVVEPATIRLKPVAEPATIRLKPVAEPATIRLKPVAEPTMPAGIPRAARVGLWTRVRRNPGVATTAVAVLMWAAAAITATIITVDGLHAVPALAAQNRDRASISSTPTASTPTAGSGASVTVRPRNSRSPEPTQPSGNNLRPAVTPTPTKHAEPSNSPSASVAASPTPTHSHPPSPHPSPTPTVTPSVSAT